MNESNERTHPRAEGDHSVFRDSLSSPNLEGKRTTIAAGTVIFEPDQTAESVYVIHRGQVRLYQIGADSASRLCEILGPDDWFGVGALAGSGTHGARAIAVGSVTLTEIRADRLLTTMAKQPEALIELTRQLSRRVQNARDEAAELMFSDTNERLVNALLRFAHSAASTPSEDGVVLNITHSQLAQAVGAARETVSLALTHLRRQNLVRTGRNQLFFNPEALNRLLREPSSDASMRSIGSAA